METDNARACHKPLFRGAVCVGRTAGEAGLTACVIEGLEGLGARSGRRGAGG